MTHVFIRKDEPKRIKMIRANNMEEAWKNLNKRLAKETNSGVAANYEFGYYF